MEHFFAKAFDAHPNRESLYKALFLMDESPYGEKVRVEYYRSQMKHMGEDVRIWMS